MLSQKIFRFSTSLTGCKYISQFTTNFKSKMIDPPDKNSKNLLGPKLCTLSEFDKWILIWMKKYKTKDEIPNNIREDLLIHIKNRARVKFANYTIIATIIGCLVSVYAGKQSQKKGDSIQKRITEWNENVKKGSN